METKKYLYKNNIRSVKNKTAENDQKCSPNNGENPCLRLYETPTKSFIERLNGTKTDTKDFLDFSLNSVYNHHFQWWAPRHVTVLQHKTFVDNVKMKEKFQDLSISGNKYNSDDSTDANTRLRPVPTQYRNDTNHTNIGVQHPHLANSRRGFGRSIDGVFYNL